MVLRILNKTKDVTKHLYQTLVKLFKYALKKQIISIEFILIVIDKGILISLYLLH